MRKITFVPAHILLSFEKLDGVPKGLLRIAWYNGFNVCVHSKFTDETLNPKVRVLGGQAFGR